jgi:hypothetical protein
MRSPIRLVNLSRLAPLLLAGFLFGAGASEGSAQTPSFTNATPPDRPAAEIWAGADEAQMNVPTEKRSNSYSGRLACLQTVNPPPAEGYFISFPFNAAKEGVYILWIACSKIGAAFASPCQYFLDGTEILPEKPAINGTKAWGTANAVSWNRFGEVSLKSGEHEFKIVVQEPRKLDTKYSIVVDAIAFVDKNGSK